MPHHTFDTHRLHLRPSSLDDAAFMLELLNTPKWILYIGDRKVYTLEDAQNYITVRILPQLDRLGFANYTVIRKSDGVKLGSCGIYDREGLEGVDIGFAFLPQYEGQGYAYESAACIRDAAFEVFGLSLISAITLPGNIGSQRLLDNLGMTYVKMIRVAKDEEELMLYQLAKAGE